MRLHWQHETLTRKELKHVDELAPHDGLQTALQAASRPRHSNWKPIFISFYLLSEPDAHLDLDIKVAIRFQLIFSNSVYI